MTPQDEHQAAQLALPWLLKGNLDPEERHNIDAHLLACAACRADLATLAALAGAAAPDGPACDPERALARLRAQLDGGEQRPAPDAGDAAGRKRQAAANDRRWLRPVLVAQCAAIAVLLGLLLRPPPPEEAYHALGAGADPAAGLVVQFAPQTPEREMRRILQADGARIVDGPTAGGAYLLRVPRERAGAVLAALRAEPSIRLAEPLAGAAQP